MLTSNMGACKPQLMSQEVRERHADFDFPLIRDAIHVHSDAAGFQSLSFSQSAIKDTLCAQ